MKFKFLILIFSVFVVVSGCTQDKKTFVDISVEDLQITLKKRKDVQLLDVRTPEEWSEGIIRNALKINVTGNGFAEKAEAVLNKSKPVYVYCRSGGRSRIAAKILVKKGYKVYNIEGGYMDWLNKKK